MMTDEDMRNALDRIARTADGELFYRWLQKELQRIGSSTDPGALQQLNGRRSLAHDLMGLMAKGLDESGGREQPGDGRDGQPSERPVVYARSKPTVASRQHGVRRRVTDKTIVAGWNDRTDPDQKPS